MNSALAKQVRQAALDQAGRQQLSREDAEDVAQETVLRFSQEPAGSIDNPAAWATRVAQNLAHDMFRRAARFRDAPPDLHDEISQAVARFLSQGQPTSLAAMHRLQASDLMALLSERERELVTLISDGFTHAEIAERMNYANAAAVKATINRVRRKIEEAERDGKVHSDRMDHPRVY